MGSIDYTNVYDGALIQHARKRIMAASPNLETASDSLINFSTDIAAPLKECRVYFEPVQEGEGEPSPENIRPIIGRTNIDIYLNSTDYEAPNNSVIPITFPSAINMLDSVTITANKTLSTAGIEANETGMSITDFIKVNQGDIYTLTFLSKEAGRTRRIYSYDANKEPIEQLTSASWVNVGTTRSLQATVPSGVEYIRVCYKTADENIFLEGPESSTLYGGYVDLIKGEIVQTHKSVILNGGENWNSYRPSEQLHFYLAIDDKKIGLGASICDIFPNAKNIKFWDQITYAKYGDHHTTPRIYVNAPYQMPGLVDEWKAYLAEHPMHLVYELETSIKYSITPQTLKTLRGTNNIWSTSNGPITIKYWKH